MADLILTSYLRARPDPQRHAAVPPDSFGYMRPWYRSMTVLGLDGVVVHDGLSAGFIGRYGTARLRFHRVRAYPWSTNDQRFFAYDRILRRATCRYAFLTDISDVRIVCNPFPSFEALGVPLAIGDEVYPRHGSTIANHPWLMQRIGETRGRSNEVFDYLRAHRFDLPTLNAGVIGGTARALRLFLREYVRVRTAIGHPERNLNMAVVNYVVHRHFAGRFHHGAPVTSRFKGFERRRDVWFVHK